MPLPFGARSSGHCIARGGWNDTAEIKHFVQLFWTVEGCGRFIIDEQETLLPENHAVIYHYGECHRLGAVSKIWNYRFMTIDGPSCMNVIADLAYPRFPIRTGPCPEELFVQLAEEVKDLSPNGQRKAAATAYLLLSLGCSPVPEVPADEVEIARQSEELIRRHYREATFNINAMAEMQQLHRSRLSRIFRMQKGLAPIDFLKGLRINRALTLLSDSKLPFPEVAAGCGFSSADYFGKAIRQTTGMTPGRFRRMHG